MWRWTLAVPLVCLPVTAQAQSMTVDEFLTKAQALKKRGVFAVLSSDLPPVRAEVKAVATSYRADLKSDRVAGRAPHSCPPPEGSEQAKIKPEVFLAELEKVPPAQRSMSMKTAFYAIMKRRWPCPGA